jgi:hypothetical protein
LMQTSIFASKASLFQPNGRPLIPSFLFFIWILGSWRSVPDGCPCRCHMSRWKRDQRQTSMSFTKIINGEGKSFSGNIITVDESSVYANYGEIY